MSEKIKKLAKGILPPVLVKMMRKTSSYGFSGDYKTWEEAESASTGYDGVLILNKVRDSLLRVKAGEAACERDSVLFDEVQHPWPLLAGLLKVALDNGGSLRVLDFGGSLGSTYFQCRGLLSGLEELLWCIVEQKSFVECGRKYFEDEHLKFHYDIDACIQNETPHAIILSAVVQYLERPYEFIEDILKKGFGYIIFDRTPFTETGRDLLTVQNVPPETYQASYPAWFFSKTRFLGLFQGKYELMAEFDALDMANIPSEFKGFIFRKKPAPERLRNEKQDNDKKS